MHRKKSSILFLSSFLFLTIIQPVAATIDTTEIDTTGLAEIPGTDNFTYGTNTTFLYNYFYKYTRKNIATSSTPEFWIPTLGNRTLLTGGGVYQQEFVILNQTWGSVSAASTITDDNGNEYYYFHLSSVSIGSSWSLNVTANYTLRSINWEENNSITIANYNTTDPEYLEYTKEEEYINKSYAPIANKAAELNDTSVFVTANNIYDYVTDLLAYQIQPSEYGAEWAIDNEKGDCTEYAYLMVALLRASGIPARVLRGIVIADSSTQGVTPNFGAPVGTTWDFEFNYEAPSLDSSNLPGHAWVEYYVPGIGWVTSDPTWHNSGNYKTRIDNIHVPYTVGVWIGDGISPSPPSTPSVGIATIPYPIYNDQNLYEVSYTFTVIEQQLAPSIFDELLQWITDNPVLFGGIVVGLIALIVIVAAVRKKRNSSSNYDAGSSSRPVYFND